VKETKIESRERLKDRKGVRDRDIKWRMRQRQRVEKETKTENGERYKDRKGERESGF
jgi:hypothetical protein